jgi:hypothetical protein
VEARVFIERVRFLFIVSFGREKGQIQQAMGYNKSDNLINILAGGGWEGQDGMTGVPLLSIVGATRGKIQQQETHRLAN